MPIVEPAVFNAVLDPAEVAAPGRVQLFLNNGPIQIDQKGLDWGDAAITAYMADQAVGSTVVDWRLPNRIITIPLFLGAAGSPAEFEQCLDDLQMKVARIQQERGTFKRGDMGLYADVVNATLNVPDVLGESAYVEENVTLSLECLPDFYGDEVTLDSVVATGGLLDAVLTQGGLPAIIAGAMPGRCRVVVTDTSGNAQNGIFWAFRSRNYASAASAKMHYNGGDLTPLDAATISGTTITHAGLPSGGWCPVLLTDLHTGGALTHTGSYRVRVACSSSNGIPQLRFGWGVGGVANPSFNDSITLPSTGPTYILDLGEIRIDAPPVGGHSWSGVIQALANANGDQLVISKVWLVPVDESAGIVVSSQLPSSLGIEVSRAAGTGANDAAVGTVDWANPTKVTAEASGASASVALTTTTSKYLKATGFGFNIPTGATISGIGVNISRSGPSSPSIIYPLAADNSLKLVRAGTVEAVGEHADTMTPFTSRWSVKSYGSESDLWGGAWTPANINDPNFGVAYSVKGIATGGGSGGTVYVDWIQIVVYFTTAGGYTMVRDAVVYANQSAELRTEGMFREDPAGLVYGPIADVKGDLPRIPASGVENRPVELLIKPSRGDFDTRADSGTDGFTVQVFYRPSFIIRS
jgi:hypothetical protein